jgi:hypothetical protein
MQKLPDRPGKSQENPLERQQLSGCNALYFNKIIGILLVFSPENGTE